MKYIKKNTICVLLLAILFISCKSEMENKSYDALDVQLAVSIKDKYGKDLLDTSQNGFIDISKVRKFYLDKNGTKIEYYYSNYDAPNGLSYSPGNELRDEKYLWIYLDETNDKSINYIKWNDTREDIITADIVRIETNVQATNIKYNGVDIDEILRKNWETKGTAFYPLIWE